MHGEIKAVFYELSSSLEVIENSGALVSLIKLSRLCLNHHICRIDQTGLSCPVFPWFDL